MTPIGVRPTFPLWKLAMLGFIGGVFATLIFHQSRWYLFNQIGLFPLERPAWPFDPVLPFGVPSVISEAFSGGVWGAVLAPILSNLRGARYWTTELWPRFLASLMLNSAWGFGTALSLKRFGAARSE